MDIMCHPSGAAAMKDGTLLVADVYNRVIWHDADGTSTVYAGSYPAGDMEAGTQPLGGYNDASYEDSLFRSPWAIAPFIAPFLNGWLFLTQRTMWSACCRTEPCKRSMPARREVWHYVRVSNRSCCG